MAEFKSDFSSLEGQISKFIFSRMFLFLTCLLDTTKLKLHLSLGDVLCGEELISVALCAVRVRSD